MFFLFLNIFYIIFNNVRIGIIRRFKRSMILLLQLRDMDIEHYYDRLNINCDEDKVVIIKNATFAWAKSSSRKKSMPKSKKNKGKSQKKLSKYSSIQRRDSVSSNEQHVEEPFKLQDIFLEIGKEELVGIAGPVGSGKTSLLLAIIGDMLKQSGDIQIPEYLNSKCFYLVSGKVRFAR